MDRKLDNTPETVASIDEKARNDGRDSPLFLEQEIPSESDDDLKEEEDFTNRPISSKAIKILPCLSGRSLFVQIEEIDLENDTKIFFNEGIRYNLSNLPPFLNIPKNLTKNNFVDSCYLCNGSHSNIYKAKYNGETIILKVLMETSLYNETAKKEFEREIEILSRIRHPHILQLIGTGEVANKSNLMRPLMALECLSGDTLSLHLCKNKFQQRRPFSEGRCLRMAKELAHALYYMHELFSPDCTLIHRDLKPDNIGFTSNCVLKLLDFGLCSIVKRDSTLNSSYKLTGFTGSLRYMAPEVALSQPYNENVDVYGFGLIVYEIFTGVTPFHGMKKEDFMSKVVKQNYRPDVKYDDYGKEVRAPLKVIDLMKRCWDPVSSNRPSAKEVYDILNEEDNLNKSRESQRSTLSKSFNRLFSSNDSI